MDNLSGQILKNYTIQEKIGAGGYGAVYRATQGGIDREVAIKVILPEHANHPEFILRFETEAQLVARLEHPHIVPLYDYWREPNTAVLVMRYLRGGSLRQAVSDATGGWGLRQTTAMLAQISSALMFAHASGVVHRDLKTDNILLDESGNCYLGDFGIAKVLGGNLNLTRDAILGTPAYLAPEQIRGEEVTARSDIYALGIVAFEVLTGVKPFFDVTPATILFKQLHDNLPDVTDLRPDVPPALNVILQRATAKEPDVRYDTAVDFALDFQRAVQEAMGSTGLLSRESLTITTDRDDLLPGSKNPYKGLRAFQQADAADFFGRGALVERLLKRLQETGDGANFLAVVGPSGSGKSSVVKAGLLPAIQGGRLDETLHWYLVDIIPGTHPLEELEAGLLSIAPAEIPALLQLLKEDTRGFVRAARRILPGDQARLVLLVDQFEELFTLVDDEATRTHFMDSLMEAVSDPRSRIKVMITLRADFYDRPLQYERFGDLMRRRTELVLPLKNDELDQAIVGPAHRVGAVFEPGLTQAIINEVRQQPGALPLLQYALTELFERREGRRLTLKAYREIGGTAGALARRADDVYTSFDDPTRAATRQMFLRLVTPGEGTEDTRRRVLQSELLSISGAATMGQVIDTFGKYRLLTFDHDPTTRTATVEVAHEALIRQWEQMRDWLDASREAVRLQRRLLAAAEEWRRAGKDPSFLAHGLQLEQFEQQIAHDDQVALNAGEREYLQASTAARDVARAAEAAREAREEALEQRARNRLRVLAVFMTISALVGVALAGFAFSQRDAAAVAQSLAEQSAAEALARGTEVAVQAATSAANANLAATNAAIAGENEAEALARGTEVAVQAATSAANADLAATNAAIAGDNAAEAGSLALSASARNALLEGNTPLALALAIEAIRAYTPPVLEVEQVLAAAAYAPGVRHRFTGQTGSMVAVGFSADGALLLTGSADGTLIVRERDTGTERYTLTPGERLIAAAFSPAGDVLAVALADFTIRLYRVDDGREVGRLTGHTAGILDLDFNVDGTLLASGGEDRTIRLWSMPAGTLLRTIEGSPGAIIRLAFAPDSRTIASTTGDATILNDTTDTIDRVLRLWDVATGEARLVVEPRSGFVRALDYSPDGATVAIGLWDSANGGTIRIYDAASGDEVVRLFAQPDIITEVVYSRDSRFIASAGWDGDVQVWDIQRRLRVQRFVGFFDRSLSLDFSPDGQYLLMGSGNAGNNEFVERARDTSAWLVDLRSRDEIRALPQQRDWIWTVDLSPDGTLAATGGGALRPPDAGQPAPDTAVRLWRTATGELVRTLNGHSGTVDSVLFLPDGRRLLTGDWAGLIILWDVETGRELRRYTGHTGRVYRLALRPDAAAFASAGGDGTVRVWSLDSGATLLELPHREDTGSTTEVNGVAFSPDATRLVTAASDRQVRLWDAAAGTLLRTYEGHTDIVNEVRFSPDGRLIASSSWDDTVRLWSPQTGAALRVLAHNGNAFGLAFTADNKGLFTTSQDRSIRLWDLTTGRELRRYLGHTDWVQEVALSRDETFILSGAQDRTARLWRVDRTAQALIDFASVSRYIRDLTCAERERYRLTLCGAPE
ncbi:MAG: protein kinase [Anaerolineae bacterium]|nr:protein kinase [Anaerolineae bacterium]